MSTQITTQKILAFDEYADFGSLPGIEGYIYIDKAEAEAYLWDSTATPPAYVRIGEDTPIPPDPTPLTFVDAATTGILSFSPNYSNGTLGVGATLTATQVGVLRDTSGTGRIDASYIPVVGGLILVKNQALQYQNGIYVITTVGSPNPGGTFYQLTRVADFDQASELFPLQVNVLQGTVNANQYFNQATPSPLVIGTSNLVFNPANYATAAGPIAFVDVATTAALPTCVYANGTTNPSYPGLNATLTASAFGTVLTVDGLTASTSITPLGTFTRVLVKNQANKAHNGDYVVVNGGVAGSSTVKWQLRRINYGASGFYRFTRYFLVSNTQASLAGKIYITKQQNPALTNLGIGTQDIDLVEYGGTSTGPFGIANSSGVYTYYASLPLAMTAITTGALTKAVVEVFANYTEINNITVTIPNGVTIQGNGYTYTNTNSSVQTLFTNANNANCNIYNYNITYAGTSNTGRCVLVSAGIVDLLGTIVTITDNAGTSGAYCVQISGSAATVRNGTAIATGGANGFINQGGTLINPIARTVNGGAVYNVSGNCYNALGITSGTGIGIQGGNFYKATGIASGNARGASLLGNCHDVQGFSQSNVGVYIDSGTYTNITGISNGSFGVQNQGNNCIVNNLRAISTASNGFFTQTATGIIINGGIIESSAALVVSCESQVSFNNVYIRSTWNSVNGHGIRVINLDTVELIDCIVEVLNSSANCLFASNARSVKFADNKWKGTTTPVNANISQAISNVQDLRGNILI